MTGHTGRVSAPLRSRDANPTLFLFCVFLVVFFFGLVYLLHFTCYFFSSLFGHCFVRGTGSDLRHVSVLFLPLSD